MHNSHGVTAMIHVRHPVADNVRSQIEAALNHHTGVTHAEFSAYVPRVVMVRYDAQAVTAHAIRRKVQEVLATDGPATCLIGM